MHNMTVLTVPSLLKKVGGARSYFATDSGKVLTKETGVQKFNFDRKFLRNGGFSAPNFVFF